MEENYKVYIHIFPNGKKYIGITKREIKDRFDNGNGYQTKIMKNAIKKYGWDNIKHEVLFENLTREKASSLEISLIKKYHTTNIKYGYNICKGGINQANYTPSKQTKLKMSKSHKGKKLSNITKQKIGYSHTKNLIGKKFGRLTVVAYARKNSRVAWECVCSCGNHKIIRASHLTDGSISSCGCLVREVLAQRNKSEKQRNILKKVMIGNKRRAKK